MDVRDEFRVGSYVTQDGSIAEVCRLSRDGPWVVHVRRDITWITYPLDAALWRTLRPRPASGPRLAVRVDDTGEFNFALGKRANDRSR